MNSSSTWWAPLLLAPPTSSQRTFWRPAPPPDSLLRERLSPGTSQSGPSSPWSVRCRGFSASHGNPNTAQSAEFTRRDTMSTYLTLMRSPLRTLVMVAAMATAASFALPQEVQAQHFGHGFGHRSSFGHSFHGSSFGHGFGGSAFYGPAYRPNRGSVRISNEFRADAQVYVDGAHVGVVDDFDGIFQSLRLYPGTYELEIELDGDRSFRQQVFVSRGRTYKLRYGVDANDAVDWPRQRKTPLEQGGLPMCGTASPLEASGLQVKPAKDEAQVYVDGARAGVVRRLRRRLSEAQSADGKTRRGDQTCWTSNLPEDGVCQPRSDLHAPPPARARFWADGGQGVSVPRVLSETSWPV